MTASPDYTGARQFALNMLETNLPAHLSYHSLFHTRDDVLPAAERLARLEGVCGPDLQILRTAVLFHDLGFTERVDNHEAISAEMAAGFLPRYGFTPRQVDQIVSMILVTRVFTPPRTLLEAIIVDADLDVLGREDFMKRSVDLQQEHAALGRMTTREQWLIQQEHFMKIHVYRTIAAQALRGPLKHLNALRIHALVLEAERNHQA